MRTRTKLATALAAIALTATIGWALRPQPVVVEVVPVTRGPFEQTIDEDGKTRVRDRYVVSAPLAGTVGRIALKAGDTVQAGDVVAVLTPTLPAFLDARTEHEMAERLGAAEAQRLRADAERLKTEAQLRQATVDRERAARLARDGFASAAAREQADLAWQTVERSLEAARSAAHAAEHDEAQARAALVRYRDESTGKSARTRRWEIRAPASGAILKVVQESEGVVALGAPLLEIADPRSLEIAVDVLSQDSIALVGGMTARVELGPDAPSLAAVVRRIEPAAFTKVSALGIEEQRVNVLLDFREPFERVRTVGDGFRVDAHIVTFRADPVVKVPTAALFRQGPDWCVFVVEGDRASLRRVGTSRRNATEALVDVGLNAGDRVVIFPRDALRDGGRVKVLASAR